VLGTVVTDGTIGAGTGGGGATSFASFLLNIKNSCANVLFVVRVASACSASHFSISWSLSTSIARGLTVFRVFWRWGRG
jgi:hypothetical protein